jgi:hypothetical protein
VSRGSGKAPARWGARESERQWKCTCVSARMSPWGAPGCAQGPEEGTAMREQLLATSERRGGSGRRRRDMERQGGVQRVLGRHAVQREAAQGQQVLDTWPARAAGLGRRENRERGLEVDEGGLICNL